MTVLKCRYMAQNRVNQVATALRLWNARGGWDIEFPSVSITDNTKFPSLSKKRVSERLRRKPHDDWGGVWLLVMKMNFRVNRYII